MNENHRHLAAAQTPETDFDGYLMLFVVGGEGPGIWRVTRVDDPENLCETCGRPAAYRAIAISHDNDPELGYCQDCVQGDWDNRLDDRAAPDPSGARSHMYAPRS